MLKKHTRRSRMVTVRTEPILPVPNIVPVFPKPKSDSLALVPLKALEVATTAETVRLTNEVIGPITGPKIPIIYSASDYDGAYNQGTIEVEESMSRADWYLQTYGHLFNTNVAVADADLPDISVCFGILIRRTGERSLAWDDTTTMQEGIYDTFVETAEFQNGVLFILTLSGPVCITHIQLKERYASLFSQIE